jgi:hypothetical protein
MAKSNQNKNNSQKHLTLSHEEPVSITSPKKRSNSFRGFFVLFIFKNVPGKIAQRRRIIQKDLFY